MSLRFWVLERGGLPDVDKAWRKVADRVTIQLTYAHAT